MATEVVTRNWRKLVEYSHSKSSEAQFVDTKFIRERLMVSRTKAFEIAKEIEDAYAPGAVIRFGRCLRVRENAFYRWVNDHSTEPTG